MSKVSMGAAAVQDNRSREKLLAIIATFIGLMAGFPSAFGATTTTFILPLTAEFGWGRIVPSLMYLASMAGMMVMSVWLGRLIMAFGAARIALISGLGLATVMGLLGWQTGSAELAIGLCFLAGLTGAGTGVGLYVSTLPQWFDHDLGRALGLSIIGQSAGMAVMPALASAVTASAGWREAYLTLGLTQLVLTSIAALILFILGRHALSLGPQVKVQSQEGMIAAEAIRSRYFWLISALLVFSSMGIFGAAIHIFPLYSDRGIEPAMLPMVALSLGAGTLIGRIGSGFLLDMVEAKLVTFLTFAIGASGIFWLLLVRSDPSLISVIVPPVLIGVALGAESDILAYLVRRIFGMRNYSIIFNRQLIPFYIGAVTGATAMGLAFDRLANPRIAVAGLVLSCLIAAILSLMLPSTRNLNRVGSVGGGLSV